MDLLAPRRAGPGTGGELGLGGQPERGGRPGAPLPPPTRPTGRLRPGGGDRRHRAPDRREGLPTVLAVARVAGHASHRVDGVTGVVVPSLHLGCALDRLAGLRPRPTGSRAVVGGRGSRDLLGGPVLVGAPWSEREVRRPLVVRATDRFVLCRVRRGPRGHRRAPPSEKGLDDRTHATYI